MTALDPLDALRSANAYLHAIITRQCMTIDELIDALGDDGCARAARLMSGGPSFTAMIRRIPSE